jgi:hypothetical protein
MNNTKSELKKAPVEEQKHTKPSVKTPKGFKFSKTDPTERVIELFREVNSYRVECSACGSIFYSKAYVSILRDMDDKMEGKPLLHQLGSWRELRYVTCINCLEAVTLQKPKKNKRRGMSNPPEVRG